MNCNKFIKITVLCYNQLMAKRLDITKILLIEGVIWFLILCSVLLCIRVHSYIKAKSVKQYQIFLSDMDGLIVGSPVKYMGVQVGHVSYAKPLSNNVYLKFVITEKDLELPEGVIANVEFYGLGGSKSLELYPPDENSLKTEKLIQIKDTFRLSDSFSLMDNMFSKIALLGGRFNYFTNRMSDIVEEQPVEPYFDALTELGRFTENIEKVKKKNGDN